MVGLGMELARSFQRLVVVFLVVSPSIGALASEIVTIITTPVPPFSVVGVTTTGILVVEMPTAVVSSGRLLGSSYVFSDQLFSIVSVGVILGCGEELGGCGWPFA